MAESRPVPELPNPEAVATCLSALASALADVRRGALMLELARQTAWTGSHLEPLIAHTRDALTLAMTGLTQAHSEALSDVTVVAKLKAGR